MFRLRTRVVAKPEAMPEVPLIQEHQVHQQERKEQIAELAKRKNDVKQK